MDFFGFLHRNTYENYSNSNLGKGRGLVSAQQQGSASKIPSHLVRPRALMTWPQSCRPPNWMPLQLLHKKYITTGMITAWRFPTYPPKFKKKN